MVIKTYSPEEIRKWILEEPEASQFLDGQEIDHIVFHLGRIANWYADEIPSHLVGDFLQELLSDSLSRAWSAADNTNRKALGLYVKFLHNHIGGDWREKAKKDFS